MVRNRRFREGEGERERERGRDETGSIQPETLSVFAEIDGYDGRG